MARRRPILIAILIFALALVGCGASGSAFDELEVVARVERGTPTLVFVYTDG